MKAKFFFVKNRTVKAESQSYTAGPLGALAGWAKTSENKVKTLLFSCGLPHVAGVASCTTI